MRRQHTSWLGMCALGTILALTSGCNFADELLQVNNPAQILIEDIDDVALLAARVAGVIDNFQGAYDDPVLEFGSYMTDEVLTGLNWEGHARTNQRITSYLEGPTEAIFEQISRAHITGKNLADQIRVWQGDDPATWVPVDKDDPSDFDPELATALVFAGYSLVVMGEMMCQSVISYDPDEPSGTVLEQVEIFDAAILFLTDGLGVASGAGEDDLMNLARTGLARASLGRGNWADAASWGALVPSGFEWWLEYVETSGGRNPLQNTSHGSNFTLGINPQFTGTHPSFDGTGFTFKDNGIVDPQTDPRIQHWTRDRTGHNRLTPLYKLFQGLRWGEYTGETLAPPSVSCPLCTGIDEDDFEDFLIANRPTNILLADYTEGQHHRHEGLAMQAGNEAEVLTFVNTRRTVGNQTALVGLTGQALITELRNQRARDLFMGGFRLGDLRRWTRFDAGNGPFASGSYFPTGAHPNSEWGDYGAWTCYPIPLSEYTGNPNLAKPANPNVPPGI